MLISNILLSRRLFQEECFKILLCHLLKPADTGVAHKQSDRKTGEAIPVCKPVYVGGTKQQLSLFKDDQVARKH